MAIKINLSKIHLKPRGKNSRARYFIRTFCHRLTPPQLLKRYRNSLFTEERNFEEIQYIQNRIDYYCKDFSSKRLPNTSKIKEMGTQGSNYERDFFEYSRFFNEELRVANTFGDNVLIPEVPSITKSRPISNDNQNCVLLNLDKVRHFVFLKDSIKFENKKNQAIFRGAVYQPHRIRFMERYYGSSWVDCGDTSRGSKVEWCVRQITLYDHLEYKFIVALEGNDVASNLKWIMSSNSIAVMPKPKFETWFMEGKLIPNVHYIEINEDYSNLPEKLQYYTEHPEEAEKIISQAHQYVAQFWNQRREDFIHLKVLERYFSRTNPEKKIFK